jgi:hypothetical protein
VSGAGFVERLCFSDGSAAPINEHSSDLDGTMGQGLLFSVNAAHCVSAVVGSILVGEDEKALAAAKKRYELLFTGPRYCIDSARRNPT